MKSACTVAQLVPHYVKDHCLDLKESHVLSGKTACAIILSTLQHLPAFLNIDSPTDSTVVIFFISFSELTVQILSLPLSLKQ